MANAALKKIWEEVQGLTPAEQRELRARLDKLLITSAAPPSEDEFEQMLLAKGLLSEMRPPLIDLTPYQNRQPIEIDGKPLSEVILEERR